MCGSRLLLMSLVSKTDFVIMWHRSPTWPLGQHISYGNQQVTGTVKAVMYPSIPAAGSLLARQHTLRSGGPVCRWAVQ